MKEYEDILLLLLEEAENLKDLPDEKVLSTGLALEDEDGFKYTIEKVGTDNKGKRLYKVVGDKFKNVFDYNEIKKRFKRA